MLTVRGVAPTLPATDVARARRFYTEVLGLPVAREMGDGVIFAVGGGELAVYESAFAGTNKATAASIEVPDAAAALAELAAAGVRPEVYEGLTDDRGMADLGDEVGFWITDTEGNILAVMQTSGG